MIDPVQAEQERLLAAAQARAGDNSPDAVGAYVRDVYGRVAPAAPAPGAGAGGAMGGTAAPAAMPSMADAATFYAYNPQTKELVVNGQLLPHDIAVWKQAAALDPSQLQPMHASLAQQHGFVPVTREQLQQFLGSAEANAEAPKLSNLAGGIMSAARSIPQGISELSSAYASRQADMLRKLGLDRVAAGVDTSAQRLHDVSTDYQEANQQAAAERRQSLTFEQQAGNDAKFTEHPLTYIAAKGSSFAGGLIPGMAAFTVNPALGAMVFTGQGAGSGQDMGTDVVRQQLANVSPEELAANPTYAALRQRGLSDSQAREAMIQGGGRTGAEVGGALGLATTPFFGRLGTGAASTELPQQLAGGFVTRALDATLPKQLAGGVVTRVLGTGTETGAITAGTNASIRGAAGASQDVNPGQLTSLEEFGTGFVGGGLFGVLSRGHAAEQAAGVSDIAKALVARPAASEPLVSRGAQPGTVESPQGDIFGSMGQQGPAPEPPGYRPVTPEGPAPVDPNQMGLDLRAPGQVADMFGGAFREPPAAAPEQAPAGAVPVDPRQQLLDMRRVGQAEDMFGAPARAPALPEPPVDQGAAPSPNPGQGELLPGALPPGARGQLIRQRAIERSQGPAPQGEPAALPPPGPTAGQHDAVASLSKSLEMVDNLLANGNFNKRTKAGRDSIAALQAERDRLAGELDVVQRDIAGQEIGLAREQRPEPTGASFRGDPQSGQLELPIGQEPSGDPRLTGALPPPGARPGDSIEPPPLPNPEPMSPQEAQARLQAQRARNPANREPQEDLFPRELKSGLQERVAQGVEADRGRPVPETTREPAADLQAQADALGKSRDTLFVAKGNEGQMPKVRRGVRKVVRDEGTLFTTNKAKAEAYRDAPVVDDALLAQLQDLPEAKGEAIAKGADVVAAEDAQGNVVKEAVASPGSANEQVVAAATPSGGKTVRRTALEAQSRRANKLAAEKVAQPTARSRADALKDRAAADKAATAAGKKKVQAEPVTADEVAAREAAPAEVKKANAALLEDVKANHPHLLEEADLADKAKTGAGRDHTPAIARLPLTRQEMSRLADRVVATAAHEAEQRTPMKDSVLRRVLDLMHVRVDNEARLHEIARAMADMEPEALHALFARVADKVADTTLAKGIVRGMGAVQAALAKTDNDPRGRVGRPELAEDLMNIETAAVPAKERPKFNPAASTGRVRVYGEHMPANAAKVVQRWLETVDPTGRLMPKTIHLSTVAESPDVSNPRAMGTSKMLNANEAAILVNFRGDLPEAAAVETLAHEFGHIVHNAMFEHADLDTQVAVRLAFEDWRAATGRLSPTEQMISRLPPVLGDLVRELNVKPERAYASEWKEWVADEVAKHLLTNAKTRGVVDQFFAKVAEALRRVYAQLTGRGRPTEEVAQMMNNFAAASRDLKGDDRAARAIGMNYGREELMDIPVGEDSRAKIAARAVSKRMEDVVRGAMDLGEQARHALAGEPEDLTRSIHNAIRAMGRTKTGERVRKLTYALSSTNDMVDRYGEQGKHDTFGSHLVEWDHAQRLSEKFAREAQQHGQLAVERFLRLSTPVRNAVQDLMYKTTVYGIHPDEPFGQGKNKHLSDEDPTVVEAMQRRYGEVVTAWQQLKDVAGNPQQVYKDLRDAKSAVRKDTFQARRENIDLMPISDKAKEEAHAMLNELEQRMLEGPYFPLTRDGSYITVARMPAKKLGRFASEEEARAAGKRYKQVNPHAEIMPIEHVDGEYIATAGEKAVYFHDSVKDAYDARGAIRKELEEAWSAENLNFAEAEKAMTEPLISEPFARVSFFRKAEVPQTGSFLAEINRLSGSGHIDPTALAKLQELYIESLPETNPRTAYLRRENIRGANRKMVEGYTRSLIADAHTLGMLKTSRQRNDAWAGMYKRRADKPEFGDVMSDLFRRQEVLAQRMRRDPVNVFASTIQDASSFISLAFSPAFLLQQTLQPVVLSLPVLAARMGREGKAVGYGKAMDYMKAAYEGAVPFFGKRGAQSFLAETKRLMGTYGGDGLTMQESGRQLIDMFGKTADERDMLTYLNDRGALDFSFLNATTDATTHSWSGAKAKSIMRLSMAFAQQAEAMNRTITGLAAYRLAREVRGMDHAEAVREANAVVTQTHGDYSRYNRPSVFNRPLAGMALQFKMYTQFMYSLMVRNVAVAMSANRSKADRAQAVRTLGYVFGSHAFFGGVTGLGPVAGAAKLGAGALMYAAAGAGLIDPKKRDQTLDDWIAEGTEDLGNEMLGEGAGRTLREAGTYGVPGMLGIDLADKIAFPGLYDTRFMNLDARSKPGDVMDQVLLSSAGPVWSNARRLANGTGELFQGDLKGAAKQMLPAAPRAWLSAATEAQDGLVTASGKVLREADDISPFQTAVRVLGLQSTDNAMAYGDRSRRQDAIARFKTNRDTLLAEYRDADPQDRAAVLERIHSYNEGRPRELQISAASLRRAIDPRARGQSKLEQAAGRAIGE